MYFSNLLSYKSRSHIPKDKDENESLLKTFISVNSEKTFLSVDRSFIRIL